MARFQRYIPLEIKQDAIIKTPEGFLIVPVTATRTGVLPYLRGDGKVVREARLPQDVFAQDSLDTMRGIPVTNDHPDGLVNSENAAKLTKGWTGSDVKARDGKYIETTVKIVDKKTIDDVMGGKVQVSAGYEIEREEIPGRFDNEEFDVIQKNIRYNHLAIVTKGRAGPDVKLRLDSADNELLNRGNEMKKVKIDGKSYDVADDTLADAIESMTQKMEKLQKDCNEMKGKKDEADKLSADLAGTKLVAETKQKELDTLQAKYDEAQSQIEKAKGEMKMDRIEVERIGRERARVEKVAEIVLDAKDQAEALKKDTIEIKKLIIKKDSPTIEEKKLESEAYVDARFDAIADRALSSNKDQLRSVGTALVGATADADIPDEGKARMKQADDSAKAWTKPLGMTA